MHVCLCIVCVCVCMACVCVVHGVCTRALVRRPKSGRRPDPRPETAWDSWADGYDDSFPENSERWPEDDDYRAVDRAERAPSRPRSTRRSVASRLEDVSPRFR